MKMESNNLINEKEIFKAAERKLYNYKYIQDKLDIIEFKLNDITVSAIDYSKDPIGKTNAFSSIVENEAIKREEKISQLQAEKKQLIYEKELIDKIMNLLEPIEQEIVNLRYFSKDKKSWTEISLKMCISKETCICLRRKIIRKIKDYVL